MKRTILAKHEAYNLNSLKNIMVQPQAEHDTGGDAEDREQDILAVDVSGYFSVIEAKYL